MGLKTWIQNKGKIEKVRLLSTLEKFDSRITALEGGEQGEAIDISDLKTTVGDENGGLVKDVSDLKTGKANANHTHTLDKVSDVDTVEAVVTYSDESTETLLLVVKDNS